jgi:CRISPR/Cas system-associated exonuclease Cas4 (RecB family)
MVTQYKRTRNIYDPVAKEPFKLSRSKIELFIECPRCFYLDRRLGVGRPGGFPFTLNNAVDALLKKEFDIHRANGTRHPLMEQYGIDAVPFMHEDMDVWRENFKGVQHYHKATNFLVTGAVDDIWQNANGELSVVDYKATSTEKEITLEEEYRQGYKRQMEIYQWLLRKNDFAVSDTGYFVYVNGRRDLKAFDGKLEFDVKILPYQGSDVWIEKTLKHIKRCLDGDSLPAPSPRCEYCSYRNDAVPYEHGK